MNERMEQVMYRIILFDVDDTLLDFKAGELKSLAKMFAKLKLTYTPRIEASYLKINANLWRDYEAGRITRPELLMCGLPSYFGIIALMLIRTWLNALIITFGPRSDLIATCYGNLGCTKDYRLFIVSNGIEPVQRQRLATSGLIDYFEDIFVSDSVGSPKPTVAFFDYVAKRIPRFNRNETLIMGDSLTSDIQGGINGKIDSIWFNPHFQPNRDQITPTYQLNEFSDLTKLLLAN